MKLLIHGGPGNWFADGEYEPGVDPVLRSCPFFGIDLSAAVRAKLEVNKSRAWSEPDADGVQHHIKPTVEHGS